MPRRIGIEQKRNHRSKVVMAMTMTLVNEAEALFASSLQPSDRPTSAQIRAAVATTLNAQGAAGCAAHLAAEYGDHPELAASRMRWALAIVAAA
jgi:uncharacterized membrane protein